MDPLTLGPLEAASRQLDGAITLYFQDGDAFAVLTLVRNAAELMARARGPAGLGAASSPPLGDLVLTNPTPPLSQAVTDIAALTGRPSIRQSFFETWCLACSLDTAALTAENRELIKATFGNLTRRSPEYCLSVGRRLLADILAKGIVVDAPSTTPS
jgi:hypothetical protein